MSYHHPHEPRLPDPWASWKDLLILLAAIVVLSLLYSLAWGLPR